MQNDLVFDLRPQSPSPHRSRFSTYLKKTAVSYFSEHDLELLAKLHKEKNKELQFCYELYLSDKDDKEFLDDLKHILEIVKGHESFKEASLHGKGDTDFEGPAAKVQIEADEKAARDIRIHDPRMTSGLDASPDSKYGGGFEEDRMSEPDNFQIFSVDTLTNGSTSELGTGRVNVERSNLVSDTPMFINDNKLLGNQKPESQNLFKPVSLTPDSSALFENRQSAYFVPLNRLENSALPQPPVPVLAPPTINIQAAPPQTPDSPRAEANEQKSHKTIQSIPEEKPRQSFNPAIISFCKRGPDRDLFLNGASQPSAPPEEQQPASLPAKSLTQQNTSEFKGFNIVEDDVAKFGSQANEINTLNTSDFPGFGFKERETENSTGSNVPNFGTAANPAGNPPLPSPQLGNAKQPDSQPSPKQAPPVRVDPRIYISFRNDEFRALLSKSPAPIVEQKEEAEISSPTKKPPALADQAQPLEPLAQLQTKQASVIPEEPQSPSKSNQGEASRPYLAQLTRFVLQQDGADKILAKLCSDFVADPQEASQQTFSEDLFEFVKKKFIKNLSPFIQPIYLEEIIEKGELFRAPFEDYDAADPDSLEKLAEKLNVLSDKNQNQLNEMSRLNEVGFAHQHIRKNMYENHSKKTPKHNQGRLFKMQRVQTSLNEVDAISEGSGGAKSKTSKYTKVSRLTGREDRKKSENLVIEKIYSAMRNFNGKLKKDLDSLVEVALKEGEKINKYQTRMLHDFLDSVGPADQDNPVLLDLLFNFGYFYDFARVKDKLL